MDTVLRIIGILTLAVSLVWLIVQPGFEPLMALLSGVITFLSSYAVSKKEPASPSRGNREIPQYSTAEAPRVFISYARKDTLIANEIYEFLRDHNCSPWMDSYDLVPGQDWKLEISNSISQSDFFIACLSNHSVSKAGYVQKELKEALSVLNEMPEGKIFLIPVRLDTCTVPTTLQNRQWLDWSAPNAKDRLLQAIASKKPGGGRGIRQYSMVERRSVTTPRLLRYLFDQYFSGLHTLLATKIRLFELPEEWPILHEYLSTLRSTIADNIKEKTYVEPYAKALPDGVNRLHARRTGFLTPIQQLIKETIGISHGGDAQSAQISALSKKSKFVRDIVKRLSQAEEPLILLGDPGTGKSITLQQAAMVIAERESKRLFPNVCLFIRLGEMQIPGEITNQSIWEYVKKATPEAIRPYLDSLDNLGRLVIFFDGMDEMSRERYDQYTAALSIFAGSRKGVTRTLFSCRITDFTPRFQHNRLVLLPFDRKHIYQYLKRQIPDFPIKIGERYWSASELANQLAKGDLPMQADNPFVLWLLCTYLQKEEDWPKSRVHLLEYYNRLNYQRKINDAPRTGESLPDMDSAFFVWGKIAYEITKRNKGAAIANNDIEQLLQPQELSAVRAGLQCGVLQKSMDMETILLRFEHHRFQEYFTALYINKNDPVKAELNWLDKLDAPRWQETLFNLVLMGGGQDALNALEEAIKQGLRYLIDQVTEFTKDRAQDETLLADRVELTSRVLQQIQKQSNQMKASLFATFQNVTYWLADNGNPITQVKMLWAARVVNGIDIFRVARRALSSDVSWVRQQALIITSIVSGGVGTGALKEDMLLSFASGRLVNRLDGFVRVAAGLKQKRFWALLGIGLLLYTLQLAAAGGLMVAVHKTVIPLFSRLETVRQLGWEPQYTWLGTKPTDQQTAVETNVRVQMSALIPTVQASLNSRWFPVIVIVAMLATTFYMTRQSPGLLLLTVQSVGYVCMVVPFLWWAIWLGYWWAVFWMIFLTLPTTLFIGSLAIWAETLLVHASTMMLFLASAYRWKVPIKSRTLREAMWENAGFNVYTMVLMFSAMLPLFWALIMFVFWLFYLVRTTLFHNLFPLLPPLVGGTLSLLVYVDGIGLVVGIISAIRARSVRLFKETFVSWTATCFALAAMVLAAWGLYLVDWLKVWVFIVDTLGLLPMLPSLVNVIFSLLIYGEIIGGLAGIVSAFSQGRKRGLRVFGLWSKVCVGIALGVSIIWGITLINWKAIWSFIVNNLAIFPIFPALVNVTLSFSLYAEIITIAAALVAAYRQGWQHGFRVFSRWSGAWLALVIITLLSWAGYLSRAIAIILFLGLLVTVVAMFQPVFLGMVTALMILSRPIRHSNYSREKWIQELRSVNPGSQVTLLRRTTPATFDISIHEYLTLLHEIEGSIQEEPALSAYWAKRYQIEQIIRQEKIG